MKFVFSTQAVICLLTPATLAVVWFPNPCFQSRMGTLSTLAVTPVCSHLNILSRPPHVSRLKDSVGHFTGRTRDGKPSQRICLLREEPPPAWSEHSFWTCLGIMGVFLLQQVTFSFEPLLIQLPIQWPTCSNPMFSSILLLILKLDLTLVQFYQITTLMKYYSDIDFTIHLKHLSAHY